MCKKLSEAVAFGTVLQRMRVQEAAILSFCASKEEDDETA
jgi:hypothetical protein